MSFSKKNQQINLALSYIASAGNKVQLENQDPEAQAQKIDAYITQSLNHSKATKDQFHIVWGPAVYKKNLAAPSKNADHVLFMVQNKDDAYDYRVVIKGSSSMLNSEENLGVTAQTAWPLDLNNPTHEPMSPPNQAAAQIANGTAAAFKRIYNAPSTATAGKGQTLIEFIDKNLPQKAQLTITGHSLGGVLASTLALHLKQTFIAKNQDITVHCCSFAGPTAGNQAFATLSEEVFASAEPSHFLRIHNTKDVVPHAWTQEGLDTIKIIYEPEIETPAITTFLINKIQKQLAQEEIHYQHISPARSFTVPPEQTEVTTIFKDMLGFQHLGAYPIHYDMTFLEVDEHTPAPFDQDIVVFHADLAMGINHLVERLLTDHPA